MRVNEKKAEKWRRQSAKIKGKQEKREEAAN